MRNFTAGCLFSGIGGFCLGFKKAGIDVLWANENDKYATETYFNNHNTIKLYDKTIERLSVKNDCLRPVDILTAGFPCQSFSKAGHRKGFDDERGKLFFQIPRIIREFGDNKPSLVLLENVPNLKSGAQGEWFDTVIKNIRDLGYLVGPENSQIINTAEVTNLPHRRHRLFIVAVSANAFEQNNFQFPCPTGCKTDPLSTIINKAIKAEKSLYMKPDNRYTKIILNKIEQGATDSIYQLRRSYVRENKGECPPLMANMGGGGHNVPFVKDRWGLRKLSVAECAKLQGMESISFPESVAMGQRYKQLGNAISVPVAYKLAQECARVLNDRNRQEKI